MVSWTLRNEVVELYKTDPAKIHVIPNGVVKEQFDVSIDPGSIKAHYGLHYMTPLICYVGRMAYQKGPDILVDAIPLILEKHWNVAFVLAGSGGMRDWLIEKARICQLSFLVLFLTQNMYGFCMLVTLW
jgi:glycosyltransferase involved in cell wall biosynthesis